MPPISARALFFCLLCVLCTESTAQWQNDIHRILNNQFSVQKKTLDSVWISIGRDNHSCALNEFRLIQSIAQTQKDYQLYLLSKLFECKINLNKRRGEIDSIQEAQILGIIDKASSNTYKFVRADAIQTLANAYFDAKKYALAVRFYLDAHALYTQFRASDFPLIENYYYEFGRVYYFFKEYANAATIFLEAWKNIPDHEIKEGKLTKMNTLALCFRNMNKTDSAMLYFNKAMKMAQDENEEIWVGIISGNIADIHFSQGRLNEALLLLNQNIHISRKLKDYGDLSNALTRLGEIHLMQGDVSGALKIEKDAYEIFWKKRQHDNAAKSRIYPALAKAFAANGYLDKAYYFLDTAYAAQQLAQKEANLKLIAGVQEKFAMEKQQRELAHKELIIKNKNRLQLLLLTGLIILFGLLTMVYVQRSRIAKERARSEALLLNILPQKVAEELKSKGSSEARLMDQVTVLFTDFQDFTIQAEKLSPQNLVSEINECFSAFDQICEKHGIEKIKTIGDSYMAAGGLPASCPDHAQRVVRAALDMRNFIDLRLQKATVSVEANKRMDSGSQLANTLQEIQDQALQMRIGIHTGPVVAGIVGVKKFQYDIWGDTVNTASRMESSGEAGKVNISEATYQLVKENFQCEYRGEIEAKGKGKLGMYFVTS